MRPPPQIHRFMTTSPHTIGGEQSLAKAKSMMNDLRVRHLPVLHGGMLIGILTDRDIKLIESVVVNAGALQVADVMKEQTYSTDPDRPIDEVAAEMAEHKYGSAVVMRNGKVIGIFTTTDACRALSQLYQ